MKFISKVKNILSTKQPTLLLGRWKIDYCNEKINKKIDLSNEDHCGVCYKIEQNKTINIKKLIFFETM
jgi:hypothetical protein